MARKKDGASGDGDGDDGGGSGGDGGKLFYLRLSKYWTQHLPVLARRLSELLGIEVSNAKAMQMALRRLEFWTTILERVDEVDRDQLLAALSDADPADDVGSEKEPPTKGKGKK